MMNGKRHYLVLLVLLLICSTLSGAQITRPNVLFIAVDDLNDWVSVFGGHSKAVTPHMDRLARDGAMVFQNAHCAGPVCCPSRSAMLSGFMPSRSGIYSNSQNMLDAPLVKAHATLPEYFSKHGYDALSMGKIFHKHGAQHGLDAGHWAFGLYDLQADPQEWHNLAGKASSAGKAATQRLADLLPKTFAEPIPYSKGKFPKARHLDTSIKSKRNLATLK